MATGSHLSYNQYRTVQSKWKEDLMAMKRCRVDEATIGIPMHSLLILSTLTKLTLY